MNRRRRTDEPVKNIHKETEYHTVVTDDGTQDEGFNCKACGKFITVRDCGTNNRNHCPHCLSSIHLDNIPGDRSADCGGIMEPISIYVRPDGEWALIHRCKKCGELKINRIAAVKTNLMIKMWANTTPITATPTASKKPQIVRLKLGMVR